MKTTFAPEPEFQELELEKRISDFKQDSSKMELLLSIINEILKNAEVEAHKKLMARKSEHGKTTRSNSMVSSIKNAKIAFRARTFMNRTFDFLSNCANTTGRIIKSQKKQ